MEDWYWATGTLPELNWAPKTDHEGNEAVLVIPTGPADELETAMLMFVHAINMAKNVIEGRCAERRNKGEDIEGCDDFKAYLVVVDFDDLKDDEKREMLKEIPTSFSLTPEQVAALRQAGKQLLQDSVAYQQFLNDMK